jgi:hypothetical protein
MKHQTEDLEVHAFYGEEQLEECLKRILMQRHWSAAGNQGYESMRSEKRKLENRMTEKIIMKEGHGYEGKTCSIVSQTFQRRRR